MNQQQRRIRFSYFGDLKALSLDDETREIYWWLCQCRCGNFRKVEEKRLLSGKITACVACEKRRRMEELAD